jgi:threonine/homoserine/homoserine lactone efflux protein
MFGITDLALFVVAGLLLNITPGPDTLYIVSRTATQGARAGAISALGIGAGLFVHTFAAALGFSALITASAAAFTLLKWIGAAYLVYVGVSLLLARPMIRESPPALHPAGLRTVFLQGFLTNVLNPKVALFFLAFLPQFVDPGTSNKALAFLVLGLIFITNGTLWNLFVAWSAARIARSLDGSGRFGLWLNRAIGAIFLYLGIKLVTSYGE